MRAGAIVWATTILLLCLGLAADARLHAGVEGISVADTLLPDIIVRQSDLYDNDIVTNIVPGRRHLRLSNATANVGTGPLHLFGIWPLNPDNTQYVKQRIWLSDSTYFDRTAGKFINHPGHDHIHIEDWSIYRLREFLPDSSVGAIVAEGAKTSFCILDLVIYNSQLANFDPDGNYFQCGFGTQGLSVGWADVYSKGLEGQNIDITEVPDGTYWLESDADPINLIREANESNNVARIIISIGAGSANQPDAFEPNDSTSTVNAMPVGAINSSNLGPCGPERVIGNLSVHASGNGDWYRFYMNHLGASGDFVRIDFLHSQGDVDLELYNSSGQRVGTSGGSGNSETISLQNRQQGWYYVYVFGYQGALNPNYTLTINPSTNATPTVTVIDPPAGDSLLIHGVDTYRASWTTSDFENDERWVTVYVNDAPILDGSEILLPTSLHTPAATGFYIINSSYVPQNQQLYVYCSVTDGGTMSGDWSSGTVTFISRAQAQGTIMGRVMDSDSGAVVGAVVTLPELNRIDTSDVFGLYSIDQVDPGVYGISVAHESYPDTAITGITVNIAETVMLDVLLSACGFVAGDADGSSNVSIADAVFMINYIFASGPPPTQLVAGDADCSGSLSIADAVVVINFIFADGPAPCGGC